jgi:hypothetical protein
MVPMVESHFMHRFLRPLCDKPVSNDRTVVRSDLIVQDKLGAHAGELPIWLWIAAVA